MDTRGEDTAIAGWGCPPHSWPKDGDQIGAPAQQFRLTEIESIGRPGIAVAGELDEASCGQLDSAFRHMSNGETVILDLGECTFMDSKALDVIVRAATRLWDDGRRLIVCNARGPVRELFRITGLIGSGGLALFGDVLE